jgi:non-heme chloroperoxidase
MKEVDLKATDRPTLIIHGDDDQIVPIKASAEKTAKLVKGSIFKVYQGGSHGLAQVDADRFNADVLAFIEG